MHDAEGWTDCHLHPIAADWRPAPTDLPALLPRLGIVAVGHAVSHADADFWDAEAAPAVLAERSEPDAATIAELAADPACKHLSLLCDPVGNGQEALLSALSARRSGWRPCVWSLGWGPTTLPDAGYARTAVRFAFSLALGGPGIPQKPEAAQRTLPRLPAVREALESLAGVLGTPCACRIAYAS